MSPFPPVGGLGVHCSLAEMTLLLNELCELDGAVSSFLAGRNGMDKLFVATCGCRAKLDQGERKASMQAASEARRTADEGHAEHEREVDSSEAPTGRDELSDAVAGRRNEAGSDVREPSTDAGWCRAFVV